MKIFFTVLLLFLTGCTRCWNNPPFPLTTPVSSANGIRTTGPYELVGSFSLFGSGNNNYNNWTNFDELEFDPNYEYIFTIESGIISLNSTRDAYVNVDQTTGKMLGQYQDSASKLGRCSYSSITSLNSETRAETTTYAMRGKQINLSPSEILLLNNNSLSTGIYAYEGDLLQIDLAGVTNSESACVPASKAWREIPSSIVDRDKILNSGINNVIYPCQRPHQSVSYLSSDGMTEVVSNIYRFFERLSIVVGSNSYSTSNVNHFLDYRDGENVAALQGSNLQYLSVQEKGNVSFSLDISSCNPNDINGYKQKYAHSDFYGAQAIYIQKYGRGSINGIDPVTDKVFLQFSSGNSLDPDENTLISYSPGFKVNGRDVQYLFYRVNPSVIRSGDISGDYIVTVQRVAIAQNPMGKGICSSYQPI